MKKIFTTLLVLSSFLTHAQFLTWTLQFPVDTSTITITMNAALGNQGLMGYTGGVYMHWGVITNLSTGPSNWRYVNTIWGDSTNTTPSQPSATRIGTNTYIITIVNPRKYFGVPAGETILEIAMLYRNGSGSLVQRNSDGSDIKVPIYPYNSNNIIFTTPNIFPSGYPVSHVPINAGIGTSVPVTAVASSSKDTLNLYFNGTKIAGPTVASSISGSAAATAAGTQTFVAQMVVNGVSSYDTISWFIAPTTPVVAIPSYLYKNGVPNEGVNYYGCTDSVSLILYAPNKSSSVVIGEIPGSNWLPQTQYVMNKTPDSNYYWITIHGLTSGTQYSYEYVVNDSVYIPDPYDELYLDGQNDAYIPAVNYPNLKAFPTNSNFTGKNGYLVGVLQTCPPTYNWKVKNFTPPPAQNLIIEEVCIRDFADSDGFGSYQLLLDSLHYFKNLGINAIELMPVIEFSGNDSWGYNPNFYCALEHSYGPKNVFKQLVDSFHANGIAVIQDIVFNQVDDYGIQVPEAKLYWDNANSRPATNSPWLNIAAPHPYGVFDDLNHTSTATQYWVERSLSYWLNEYHIDGFRFDLGKGFTQTCSQVNALCSSITQSVENYDQSRVNNLERYYNFVQSNHPGKTMPYMIIEFLGTQDDNNSGSEENVLSNYGFMLWNDVRVPGAGSTGPEQTTMGYGSNSNMSKAVYNSGDESFNLPNSDSYEFSHDMERSMYNNEVNGNTAMVQSISGAGGGLQREAAMAACLFFIPGPHMFYMFSERGYDVTIEYGGSNTAYKPPHWEYLTTDANATARKNLVSVYQKLLNLRVSNPGLSAASSNMNYNLYDNGGLFRLFQNTDTSAAGLSITVVANFDITNQTRSVTFQNTGNWYNYVSDGTGSGLNGATGSTVNLTSQTQSITLAPGEFHVYLFQPATTYTFIGNGNWNVASNWINNTIPPNPLPSGSTIYIEPTTGATTGVCVLNITQTISAGAKIIVEPNKYFQIPGQLIQQ